VPYTKRPGEVIPGLPTYYASTFQEGWNVQGVLVKTREGRPILIEGIRIIRFLKGTVSLRAMGDLLSLYDSDRLRAPSYKGAVSTWKEAGNAMARVLNEARIKRQACASIDRSGCVSYAKSADWRSENARCPV